METTKHKCIECGNIGNVQTDCSQWACPKCSRIQPATSIDDLLAERDRLRYVNAELVAALKALSADCDGKLLGRVIVPRWAVLCAAETALAKAEEAGK